MKNKNLLNQRFGRLLVVEEIKSTGGRSKWKCVCDCGNIVTLGGYKLISGNNKSCGCLRNDMSTERIENYNNNKIRKKSRINNFGYRVVFDPDSAQSNIKGERLEHRKIMEEYIGRPLTQDEVIHHINKNRLDNRIENLRIMTRSEHQRLHINEYWKERTT